MVCPVVIHGVSHDLTRGGTIVPWGMLLAPWTDEYKASHGTHTVTAHPIW